MPSGRYPAMHCFSGLLKSSDGHSPPLHALSFLLLLAGLLAAWTWRYEAVPGSPRLTLRELKPLIPPMQGLSWQGTEEKPVLRLSKAEGEGAVSFRVALPGLESIDALHLRGRLKADALLRGPEPWLVGRLLLTWLPADGGVTEQDPIAGVEDDALHEMSSLVAVPADAPATPLLLICHHGVHGAMDILDLELQPVRETKVWRVSKWILLLMFWVWLVFALRSSSIMPFWKPMLAAWILMILFIQFVIPGPWKIQRPLGWWDFHMGEEVSIREANHSPSHNQSVPKSARDADTSNPVENGEVKNPVPGLPSGTPAAAQSVAQTGPVPPVGKVYTQGSLAIRIKERLEVIRPILHVMQFLIPALILTLLVGRKTTLICCILLMFATESSQFLFGYGFDAWDVLDLLLDSLGIGLGVGLAHVAAGYARRKKAAISGPPSKMANQRRS